MSFCVQSLQHPTTTEKPTILMDESCRANDVVIVSAPFTLEGEFKGRPQTQQCYFIPFHSPCLFYPVSCWIPPGLILLLLSLSAMRLPLALPTCMTTTPEFRVDINYAMQGFVPR
ncbi:hypothetical protein KQX54_005647 [Cotesia glomerata]|uniref:Uncharacterized protein n=1 Tax=Cotesia glomerata TaxID=32391 RepID=A0AAV7ITS0_COTGL|nr:hypothetical protein KQX54_005647 [Cotesia glomerata]